MVENKLTHRGKMTSHGDKKCEKTNESRKRKCINLEK